MSAASRIGVFQAEKKFVSFVHQIRRSAHPMRGGLKLADSPPRSVTAGVPAENATAAGQRRLRDGLVFGPRYAPDYAPDYVRISSNPARAGRWSR